VALVSAVYYLGLASFTHSTKTSRRFLGILALLSFNYFYPYLLGESWEIWRPHHLIITLTLEIVALAYTFYVIVERYRGMLQMETEVNDKTLPDVLQDDTFGHYLVHTFHGEKHFLRDDYSMEMLSSDSGHSPAAWRSYFKSKDTTFLIVKKRMRIDHATQLIVNGYLDNHTVEALTSEIGYASRSTFYSAFQEIKGMPFPQYLQELRKS
jgi:AraC-like DNA-binding protein